MFEICFDIYLSQIRCKRIWLIEGYGEDQFYNGSCRENPGQNNFPDSVCGKVAESSVAN